MIAYMIEIKNQNSLIFYSVNFTDQSEWDYLYILIL